MIYNLNGYLLFWTLRKSLKKVQFAFVCFFLQSVFSINQNIHKLLKMVVSFFADHPYLGLDEKKYLRIKRDKQQDKQIFASQLLQYEQKMTFIIFFFFLKQIFYTQFVSLYYPLQQYFIVEMRIQKCYFCSGPVYPGHGTTFVRNDCKVFKFCRAKCHKHFKAKHNPRKLAWTKAYRKLNNKQLAKDSIFQFERKVNQPQIYNRKIYINTIQAMKRISDIRKRRQDRFWENRMKLARVQKIENVNKQLEKHADLISDPEFREQVKERQQQRLKVKQQVKAKRGQLTIDME